MARTKEARYQISVFREAVLRETNRMQGNTDLLHPFTKPTSVRFQQEPQDRPTQF